MMPGNPVVGGTVLRIPAIQSGNYVAGSAGWSINADGTAQFADATFTDGVITLGGNGELLIYSGTPAAGTLRMSMAGTGGTDAYGNTFPSGFAIFDSTSSLIMQLSSPHTAYQTLVVIQQGSVVFEINNEVNQTGGVGFEWSNGNGEVFANVTADANNILQLGLNGAPYINVRSTSVRERIFMGNGNFDIGPVVGTTQAFDGPHLIIQDDNARLGMWVNGTEDSRLYVLTHEFYLDCNPTVSLGAVHVQLDANNIVREVVNGENWHDISFINGFAAGSQSGWHSGIRYRRSPSEGSVYFDGIVSCPASPGGKIMGAFPAGYRPSSNQVFWGIAPANSPKIVDILVDASGNITYLSDISNPAGTGSIYLTGHFPTT